jgi:hypothetical protein
MKSGCVAFALVAALVSLGAAGTPYRVGDRVEDFSLTTLDGATGKLSDHRAKVVLLTFFATW